MSELSAFAVYSNTRNFERKRKSTQQNNVNIKKVKHNKTKVMEPEYKENIKHTSQNQPGSSIVKTGLNKSKKKKVTESEYKENIKHKSQNQSGSSNEISKGKNAKNNDSKKKVKFIIDEKDTLDQKDSSLRQRHKSFDIALERIKPFKIQNKDKSDLQSTEINKKTENEHSNNKQSTNINTDKIKTEETNNLEPIAINTDIKEIMKKSYKFNENSMKNGETLFSWIINPKSIKKFFCENWEKRPLVVKRYCRNYYSHIISCEEIDQVLHKKALYFTKNIDITSYSKESGRETHNSVGRATAPLVWDYYSNGCSIRILNPQTFFPQVHSMNATLQEYFGCFVGANVYLTPAGTQGFAPHYDDIEAFVLQIEGEKLWKLYSPRRPEEELPRFSSGNFKEEDLGAPIKEVLLQPGDMLYFPRGTIHQGRALEHTHSLHITLSVYQKTSWADLFETLIPAALNSAFNKDISFRRGLPMHYLNHMGIANCDRNTVERLQFINKAKELFAKLLDYSLIDSAVDQLGKNFIHDSLPPCLDEEEKTRSSFGDGETIANGEIFNQAEIGLDTKVKLIRLNCLRLVIEDKIKIYYSVHNSLEYHGEDLNYLEVDENVAPAIDVLISSYPQYVTVEDLPLEDDLAKVQIISDLWEQGLILTEESISLVDDF